MNIKEFRKHCETIINSKYKIYQEFKKLSEKDKSYPAKVSDSFCNNDKNRFCNILAYDHSRFVISGDKTESDYINASFIQGFNSEKEYIAAQGPLKSTEDDFWKMVWQSESKTIVMLTVADEKSDLRCLKYWPSSKLSTCYGKIQVENINEILEKFEGQEWLVTDFKIKFKEKTRNIKHFQFLTWEDYDSVDPPEALIKFTHSVRNHAPYSGEGTAPIIAHCSAGVGRTGTWIAIDILMHQIREKGQADVYKIIKNLRKERMWMVQTEGQYMSIYKAALAYIQELNGAN